MSSQEVKGISIQIGADTLQFDNSITGVRKALRSLNQESRDLDKQLRLDPTNMELLGKQTEVTAQKTELLKKQIQEFKDEQVGLEAGSKEWSKLQDNINKAERQLSASNDKLEQTNKLLNDLGDENSIVNIDGRLKSMGNSLDEVNSKMKLDGADEFQLASEKASLLNSMIDETKAKLDSLESSRVGTTGAEFDKLTNEIVKANNSLSSLESELVSVSSITMGDGLSTSIESFNSEILKSNQHLDLLNAKLKNDPSNFDVLSEKMSVLGSAIQATEAHLDELKAKAGSINEVNQSAYQEEVMKTEMELVKLQGELEKTGETSIVSGDKMNNSFSVENLTGALLVVEGIKKTIDLIVNSIDGAIERFDTLNSFGNVMENLGFADESVKQSMDELSDGIEGLPTKLDAIVSSTQQIVSATNDLQGGTETAIAFNNAMLAGGATTEQASSAMRLYSQALSKGTIQADAFNSMQENSAMFVSKMAEAFEDEGITGISDFREALSSGEISVDDFNNKLLELNDGTDVFVGFEEMARSSSEGIGNSLGNLKNAITKNVAETISIIDEALQRNDMGTIASNLDSLKGAINDTFTFINSTISVAIDLFVEYGDIVLTLVTVVGTFIVTLTTLYQTVKLAKKAWASFNAVLNANPIMATISLITALVAGLVVLYNTSETFRDFMQPAVDGVQKLYDIVTSVIGTIVFIFEDFFQTIMDGGDLSTTYLSQLFIAWGNVVLSVFKSLVTFSFDPLKQSLGELGNVFNEAHTSKMAKKELKAIEKANNEFTDNQKKANDEYRKAEISAREQFNNQVSQLNQQHANKIKELDATYNEGKEKLDKENAEKQLDINEKLNKGLAESNEKLAEDLMKIDKDYNKKKEDINKAYQEAMVKSKEKYAESILKIEEDLNNKTADETEKLANRLKSINEELSKSLDKISKDFDKSMKKIEETLSNDLDRALEQRTKAIQQANKNLDKTIDQGNKTLEKSIKQANDRLEKSVEQGNKNLQKAYDRADADLDKSLRNIDKTLTNNIENIIKSSQNDIDRLNKAYESEFASVRNNIYNQMGLFDEIKWGESHKDTLALRLEEQLKAMDEFNDNLEQLSTKGASDEFIKELEGMGLGARDQIRALTTMSEEELNAYQAMWLEKNAKADAMAQKQMADKNAQLQKDIAKAQQDAQVQIDEAKKKAEVERKEAHVMNSLAYKEAQNQANVAYKEAKAEADKSIAEARKQEATSRAEANANFNQTMSEITANYNAMRAKADADARTSRNKLNADMQESKRMADAYAKENRDRARTESEQAIIKAGEYAENARVKAQNEFEKSNKQSINNRNKAFREAEQAVSTARDEAYKATEKNNRKIREQAVEESNKNNKTYANNLANLDRTYNKGLNDANRTLDNGLADANRKMTNRLEEAQRKQNQWSESNRRNFVNNQVKTGKDSGDALVDGFINGIDRNESRLSRFFKLWGEWIVSTFKLDVLGKLAYDLTDSIVSGAMGIGRNIANIFLKTDGVGNIRSKVGVGAENIAKSYNNVNNTTNSIGNISVSLVGSDMSPNDVADAIERKIVSSLNL